MSDTKQRFKFSDGEGIVYSDFNGMLDTERLLASDYGLAPFARRYTSDSFPTSAPHSLSVFTPPGFGGIIKPGAAANQISNSHGAIYMLDANASVIDGLTPHFLVYDLALDELQTTITPDPTNPVWVGIFVKLAAADGPTETRDFEDEVTGIVTTQSTVKSKVAKLTKQVVYGTPAASPVPPAAPAGFAAWGYVYVTAAHAGTFDYLDLVDCHYPIGTRSVWVHWSNMQYNPAAWSASPDLNCLHSTGSGSVTVDAWAGLESNARIIRATWFVSMSGPLGNFYPARFRLDTVGVIAPGTPVVSAGDTSELIFDEDILSGVDTNPNSGTSEIKGPLWGNGYRHPFANGALQTFGGSKLQVDLTAGSVNIYGVRFDVLG